MKGRSDNTIRAYRADLEGLLEWAGEPFPIKDFEIKAATFLNEQRGDYAAKTVQRKLGTFRGFGERAGIEDCLGDYTAPTPARAVAHPVKGGTEAVRKMYDRAARENRELAALIALCGFQGLRVHEALATTVQDFDVENMELRVHGKGDKERVIPLYQRVFSMVAPAFAAAVANPDDDRLVHYSDRGARKAITRIGKKVGLGDVASHDLRSTFATESYRRSKSLRSTQELLGHSSSATTETYTHISMDEMRDAGDILGDES